VLEEYVRLGGVKILDAPNLFPEGVIEAIRQIADRRPEIDVEICGGLADELGHSETSRGFRPR
jgi:hypothetical protein